MSNLHLIIFYVVLYLVCMAGFIESGVLVTRVYDDPVYTVSYPGNWSKIKEIFFSITNKYSNNIARVCSTHRFILRVTILMVIIAMFLFFHVVSSTTITSTIETWDVTQTSNFCEHACLPIMCFNYLIKLRM